MICSYDCEENIPVFYSVENVVYLRQEGCVLAPARSFACERPQYYFVSF